ncbi:hypothetical protein ACFSVJ_06495 [Prauserella oleivorans]
MNGALAPDHIARLATVLDDAAIGGTAIERLPDLDGASPPMPTPCRRRWSSAGWRAASGSRDSRWG